MFGALSMSSTLETPDSLCETETCLICLGIQLSVSAQ